VDEGSNDLARASDGLRFVEPVGFAMDRGMHRGIKKRIEA
jgi:hypothetical protein